MNEATSSYVAELGLNPGQCQGLRADLMQYLTTKLLLTLSGGLCSFFPSVLFLPLLLGRRLNHISHSIIPLYPFPADQQK